MTNNKLYLAILDHKGYEICQRIDFNQLIYILEELSDYGDIDIGNEEGGLRVDVDNLVFWAVEEGKDYCFDGLEEGDYCQFDNYTMGDIKRYLQEVWI